MHFCVGAAELATLRRVAPRHLATFTAMQPSLKKVQSPNRMFKLSILVQPYQRGFNLFVLLEKLNLTDFYISLPSHR